MPGRGVSAQGRKTQGGKLLPICLSKSEILLRGAGYYWTDLSLHLFEEFSERFFCAFHHLLALAHMEQMPAPRIQGIRQDQRRSFSLLPLNKPGLFACMGKSVAKYLQGDMQNTMWFLMSAPDEH